MLHKFATVFSLCILLAEFAFGQITFVGELGTATQDVSGTSLSITLSKAVPIGRHITVAFVSDANAGTISGADDRGNTYTLHASVNGSNHDGAALSAPVTTALQIGDNITVSNTNSKEVRAMSVQEWSGINSPAEDKVASAFGTGTTPDSGLTATTTQADELIYGVITWRQLLDKWSAAGSGYTALTGADVSKGAADRSVRPEYKIVAATAQYKADATLVSSIDWIAICVTLKSVVAVGPPPLTPQMRYWIGD